MEELLLTPVAHVLGWTLFHSLWQGALIAGLVLLGRRLIPETASRARHTLAFAAMNTLFICAGITLALQDWPVTPVLSTISGSPILPELVGPDPNPGTVPVSLLELVGDHVHWLAPIWLAGYLFFLIRFLAGRFSLWALRRSARPIEQPEWRLRFAGLTRRIGIRKPVRLLTSALVRTPVTFGWIKPVVLLPVGLVNHLQPAEVEAILLHELAHILRQDYLWNTWQQVLECLFYYHPLTWWLSGQIRDEREFLCDEITLGQQTKALDYARALLHLQEWRTSTRAALAATGRKEALLHRIQRLFDHTVNHEPMSRKWLIPMLLILPALLLAFLAWIPSADGLPGPDDPVPAEIRTDSVPEPPKTVRKEIRKIIEEDNGVRQEATFENGKLSELRIDGQAIPADKYDDHRNLIDRMQEKAMSLAPTPPPPPKVPPGAPKPPAPPLPPGAEEEVTEWTTDTGGHEKHIIIRKHGQPGERTEKRIRTIVIDGDDARDLEFPEDGEGRKIEKRIEIIRDGDGDGRIEKRIEILGDGEVPADGPRIFRFRSGDGEEDLAEEMARVREQEFRIREDASRMKEDAARMKEKRMMFMDGETGKRIEIQRGMDLPGNFSWSGSEGHASLHDRLARKMKQEGLITNLNEYSFDLSDKRLKVDGHKMPPAVHRRYMDYYETMAGHPMGEKDRVRARIDND